MFAPVRNYLQETKRPIYSAALVLPFFVIYHVGTVVFKTTYINGADALIIQLLRLLTVNSMLASAFVLLICFLIWQISSRASWEIDTAKLIWMFAESLVYAFILLYLFGWVMGAFSRAYFANVDQGVLEKLVLYCGAGIYEELLFRGLLLGGLILLFQRVIGLQRSASLIWATVISSLLFSAFHYIGPSGDHFSISSFTQRTVGGLYFAVLFVTRGFGITAATHAFYDMIVAL